MMGRKKKKKDIEDPEEEFSEEVGTKEVSDEDTGKVSDEDMEKTPDGDTEETTDGEEKEDSPEETAEKTENVSEESEEKEDSEEVSEVEEELEETSSELEDMASDEMVQDTTEEGDSEAKRSVKERVITWCVVAAVVIGLYFGIGGYYCFHYQPRTVVNGIDCAGMSVEELEGIISEQVSEYELTLVERDGEKEILSGADFDLHAVYDDTLDEIIRTQSSFLWPRAFFTDSVYDPDTTVEWEEKQFTDAIAGLSCTDESRMVEPKNAEIVFSGEEDAFVISAAEYGTLLVPDAFEQAVKDAVSTLTDTLHLVESGCYVEPKVTEDQESILSVCEEMNDRIAVNITYDMLDIGEIPITKEQMSTWVTVNDAMEVSYDEEAIAAFVADFAEQYDTRDKEHTLETTEGSRVAITNVHYGWQLDQERELEEILEELEVGEDVTREPMWTYTAKSHGENDYGNTYVEVSIAAQHLYFYKNGKLIVESSIVSGNVSAGHSTHKGIYEITYKQRGAVLRGPGYETPVSYWMPFNGGEGLHDATWRSSFGGSIYKTDGSHGCVNLPYSAAKAIFEEISVGDCVIVY